MSGRDFTALERFCWSLSVETAEGKFLGGMMFMVLFFLRFSLLLLFLSLVRRELYKCKSS